MASATQVHEGEWRRLVNLAAQSKGSIHDDETARKMGFAGGFVPGSTVATAGLIGVVSRFGKNWFDGGWYTFKFITPVYVHEEVREVAESVAGSDDITIGIVTNGGRTCSLGRAGLGAKLGPQGAWDPAADGTSEAAAHLHHLHIGDDHGTIDFTIKPEDVARLLDAAGDPGEWYRAQSPWGAPIVPPEQLMSQALQMSRVPTEMGDEARGPLIWADHSFISRQPVFVGQPYRMTSRLANKGRSTRTLFVETEFVVTDAAGTEFARGRQKLKRFAADAPTAKQ